MNQNDNNQESSLKNKTAKGLFWGGISNGTQQILQLLFGIIMLYILSPEDYGIVGALTIFIAIAIIIQDGGFTVALINRKKAIYEDYNAVFWFNIISSSIIYLFLFFAAPFIADFFNIEALTSVSRVLFLNFIFLGIGNAHYAFMTKELMVKEKAKIDIVSTFVSGIIGIILAISGFSYWAIVVQNVSYFFIATLQRWFYVPWTPSFNINMEPLKKMFSFSINLFLTNIFAKISENIFSVLLAKYYNEKTVGYYSQGNKWSVMGGNFLSGMITNVAMPIFTQIKDDKERQRHVFRKMLRLGAFISFPLLLGLAFVGKEFLLIVGNGDKWQPATPFLQLFCIWNSVYFMWSLYTNMLLTHKKSNIYMAGTILVGTLQLIVITLLFKYGILQMVSAYICVYFIGLLFWHYYTNKLIGLRLYQVIKDIIPFFIVTVACILCVWFITKDIENLYVRFILKITITPVFYLFIMWKSNSVIVQESFTYIKNLKKRN